jgi:D-alanine-D-alanine ligase
MKWVEYDKMKVVPTYNPETDRRLREYTTKVFLEFKGRGYARCDYRLGKDGELYMLEINPNCGIFYPPFDPGSADFSLLADPMGHQGFMDLIIRSALKRQADSLRVVTPQIVGKRELVKQEIVKPQTKRQAVKRETAKRNV